MFYKNLTFLPYECGYLRWFVKFKYAFPCVYVCVFRRLTTLNKCAAMSLEVHFQCKQVNKQACHPLLIQLYDLIVCGQLLFPCLFSLVFTSTGWWLVRLTLTILLSLIFALVFLLWNLVLLFSYFAFSTILSMEKSFHYLNVRICVLSSAEWRLRRGWCMCP